MMKKLSVFPLLLLLATPAANADGLTGFLRGVTGALGGTSNAAPQQAGVTPTLGVRGMDEENGGTTGAPAAGSADLKRLESWAETGPAAEAAAAKRGLVARQASYGEGVKP